RPNRWVVTCNGRRSPRRRCCSNCAAWSVCSTSGSLCAAVRRCARLFSGCRGTRVRITGMAPNVVPVPAGVDPVALLRRYEPVIICPACELFFPMAVDAYVEQAALWGRAAGKGERKRLVDHGDLDLDVLCT